MMSRRPWESLRHGMKSRGYRVIRRAPPAAPATPGTATTATAVVLDLGRRKLRWGNTFPLATRTITISSSSLHPPPPPPPRPSRPTSSFTTRLSSNRSEIARLQAGAKRWAYGLTAVAAWAAGIVAHADDGSGKEKDKDMNIAEAVILLRDKLGAFRKEQEQRQGVVLPRIKVMQDQTSSINTVVFRLPLPSSCDATHVFTVFLTGIISSDTDKIVAAHSAHATCTGDYSLSFVLNDQSGSIIVKGSKGGPKELLFFKDDFVTSREIDGLVDAYKACFGGEANINSKTCVSPKSVSMEKGIESLKKLGLDVYEVAPDSANAPSWDCLAGYEDVKKEIEDTVVLALQNPEIYERIAKKTRCRYESNRPRAVLFEGPPGTGKTMTAKIIAQQAGIPMIHIPIEGVVSKWYGDSEKKLSAIFDACGNIDGAIIFIDEIDALAADRGSGSMHEATRRMLSVLLQKIEGFEAAKKVTLICATNRKKDLDSALISRFDLTVKFDLPTKVTRSAVFKRYAKHLTEDNLNNLASMSAGMSCRDIKEICEHTERKWASKLLRKEAEEELPPFSMYCDATKYRYQSLRDQEPVIEA